MDDAIFFQWLEKAEEILKEVPFRAFGTVRDIPADRVQLRDGPFETQSDGPEDEWRDEDLPAIFITPANEIGRPANDGTQSEDDVHYRAVVQIADKEDGRFNRDRLRTHLRWLQDISRALHGYDWTGVDFVGGCPVISWTQSTRVIDPQAYWRHRHFVRGVLVTLHSRETRTIT